MNIYFCREKDEFAGLFVVASTRGRAKLIFAKEVDCSYTDVRSNIQCRGVGVYPQGCLYDWDERDKSFMYLHGLQYGALDDWEDFL